jgi:hypothetical protein
VLRSGLSEGEGAGQMRRISSRTTFFNKRVFPVIWFGFVAFAFLGPLLGTKTKGGSPAGFLLVPMILAAFGYIMMKKFVFDLADEVFDDGNSLVVRFGTEEERIPLSEIINISYTYLSNPSRITLTLRTPGRFGKEVSFSPPQSFVPFAKSPIVADLIERTDAARRS